jgi:hypothetical protein
MRVASNAPMPAGQVTDAPIAPPGGGAPVTLSPGGPAAAAEAASDKPASERTSKDDVIENRFPNGLSISLGGTMNFGSSTFVLDGGYTRDPLVTWSTSLSPSYSFPDATRISASVAMSQELTKADGDDEPYTVLFSDVSLVASRPIYNFEHGPKLSGSLSTLIPVSTASRADSLITSLGARINAAQRVGKFGLSLGTGVRKNFHRYTHPVRDPATGRDFVTRDGLAITDVVTGISRNGGSELAGNTYFEGEANNTSLVWATSLGASYPVTDRLSLGISYGIAASWTYDSYPLDQYSSPNAKAGHGRGESQTGTLTASYEATDKLSFGLGMVTGGGLRSADDKRFRFPFYAFEGAESNLTTFFVSATYTEAIPL